MFEKCLLPCLTSLLFPLRLPQAFVVFVQLMEERRRETELAANHGVVLIDAPALCV